MYDIKYNFFFMIDSKLLLAQSLEFFFMIFLWGKIIILYLRISYINKNINDTNTILIKYFILSHVQSSDLH